MKTLIGGAVAVLIGVVGLAVFFNDFLSVIAGSVPPILLLGGGLALYLGFDELKDSWTKEKGIVDDPNADKDRIAELEKELEEIKNQK